MVVKALLLHVAVNTLMVRFLLCSLSPPLVLEHLNKMLIIRITSIIVIMIIIKEIIMILVKVIII